MKQIYLQSVRKQFEYYKSVGEKTFEQLSDEELFRQTDKENNSISIIVNHLRGNMMSRWTDFMSSDGEKEWRERDKEFENVISDREEMMHKWEEGWACLFSALNSVNEGNFHNAVYIRNQEHSIIDAVNRQLAHYAYHVGQIVFIGKMNKASSWKSLTIPKGKSGAFNIDKFSRGKHGGHFSDD